MTFVQNMALRLTLINLLLAVACIIFAPGFFPYKPYLPGVSRFYNVERGVRPEAPFKRLVFMVVDALRSDFVYSHDSGFLFTQSLIRDGSALPFTARALAPTVTMPRVKALTTGSIPSFVDMILNFAESDTTSTLAEQDSWLRQMALKKAGHSVMYGDDTWLKLFPNMFERYDGTSSFFVSDFTEVDQNVTRHIPHELKQSDWNVMILHYLGMDHIGHKAGPRSPNMIPKQTEMDGIVKSIYQGLTEIEDLSDALLVVCGDHGMNEGGNHGGSAPGETSPALLFISPKFKPIALRTKSPIKPYGDFSFYETVEQSNVAPTLAALFGFPVPLNNLGVLISQFLGLWPAENDRIELLHQNALQLQNIVAKALYHPIYDDSSAVLACENPSSDRDKLACQWKVAIDAVNSNRAAQNQSSEVEIELTAFSTLAQSILSSAASNYDTSRMGIGIILATLTLFFCLFSIRFELRNIGPLQTGIFSATCVLYVIMMLGSSFVEEEQQFWYWATSIWFALHAFQGRNKQDIMVFLLISLQRTIIGRWNQSGQKHSGASDIVSLLKGNIAFLETLVLVSYGYLTVWLKRGPFAGLGYKRSMILSTVTSLLAVAFKLAFTAQNEPENVQPFLTYLARDLSLNALAQAVFLNILVLLCLTSLVFGNKNLTKSPQSSLSKRLFPLIVLFLMNQMRWTNLPMFLFYMGIHDLQIRTLDYESVQPVMTGRIALSSLFLAHCSYFGMGGTNSISSLDLSNAYNGIASYNPVPVGILLFVGNWAGPLFFGIGGLSLISSVGRNPAARASPVTLGSRAGLRQSVLTLIGLQTAFFTLVLLSTMISCYALREHLFVWTVFSPKFLYAMAWVFGYHWTVCGISGLLWLLGEWDV